MCFNILLFPKKIWWLMCFSFVLLIYEPCLAKDEYALFPDLINLASRAIITSNATCGQNGPEYYCSQTDNPNRRDHQCGVCDARSPDPSRRHPPENAIDSSPSTWWQSPTLASGLENQWVTLTLDLREVYQIAYVIVKSANAPRPGNWILERSIDNYEYKTWRYFAKDDDECFRTFGIPATRGHSPNATYTSVTCTSFFSRVTPVESGEIHASLVSGSPAGEDVHAFSEARYIRLRFQQMNSVNGNIDEISSDYDTLRRHYYSIKDINIGGRCMCNGHATRCNIDGGRQRCNCVHNTCGDQCDRCCPEYNQYSWRKATSENAAACGKCQCHKHASSCRYDDEVAQKKNSINIFGDLEGGGVCLNCQHFTVGVNCERCQRGYYRPQGTSAEDQYPCLPCHCEGIGTTDECIRDDTQVNLGRHPGICICKQGFTGPLCNQCAPGYLNYPSCEACPCSRAGTVDKACTGKCTCKENVEGPSCDTCVKGTFHLDEFYHKGCTECFCNNVVAHCEAARLAIYLITEKERWQVTDLRQRRVIAAAQYESSISVAHEDMSKFQSYFWLAPSDYIGKKQTAYGQNLTIKSEWITLRGDTSGKPTRAPDVIIEGDRFRIAYGGSYYPNTKSAFLQIPLREDDWYHFPKDIADIPIDLPTSDYQLRKVSRGEMMEVLSNIKSMMFRARYHTEQVESLLHDVILEYGREEYGETVATLLTGAVERCFCPPGYTGLSCESCELGYRRVDNLIIGGECTLCLCNGHVEHCDPFNGACGECKHNTAGENCERCAPGFYGDATKGTPDDCKPCFCPLGVSQNEFVPQCVAADDSEGFKCICPRGYDGPRCQQCADGYFGNPMVPGNRCRPCDCSGNVDPRARGNCDRLTGRCLLCLGNTAGLQCEKCKDKHYGDPKRGQCIKCGCHELGSVSGNCELQTGQCQCKPLYTGRQCERCISGRGNIHEGCPQCMCSPQGSITNVCDAVSGQCPCRPGVGGRHCDSCLENFYGNIANGCNRCDCDVRGSLSETCDIITGQCQCRRNIVGRTCNSCRPGFWGLANGADCQKCDCESSGTVERQCDDKTGQCQCTQGVGGPRCDRCLPGYWGFAPGTGCRPCEPCGFPGKNCDLTSGKCVCPPNTEGDKCERCSQGFWDYSADIGCRACRCSGPGSLERQCDPRTGRCVCRDGYEGPQCDKCSFGYFGYPHCRSCNCNPHGTDPRRCREEGRCQCDNNGQCPCKPNVSGRACGKCNEGTFGLSGENPLGCFNCFCFKKSLRCTQAELTWSQLALPGNQNLELSDEETQLNITNQLYVIPNSYGDVTIGTSLPFLAPLYWQLPKEFMRDKIHSYNGYLQFRVQIDGNKKTFPDQILQSYPLVSLQGNWQLVLEFYPNTISKDGRYKVKLNEEVWRLKNDPRKVTREQMMIALQNIQHILIRATHSDDFTSATLSEVTLDVASEGTPVSSRRALGVERCFCPESYSGLSCQNPNIGFYRWYKENHIQSQIIIDLVGESKPCDCNGRADTCHQETGECMNCRENTMGPNCEVCATGYYGNPNRERCKPCACPSRQQNFAKTCQADRYSEYICHCLTGYTGNKCEKCADGYYGNPSERGGSCQSCKCDPNGSIGRGCDSRGNCRCKPGITGRDCSQCQPRHVVAENGCISCEDGCVNVLLDDVESMINQVTSLNVDGQISAPWPSIKKLRITHEMLKSQLDHYESRIDVSQDLLLRFGLEKDAKILKGRTYKIKQNAEDNVPLTLDVKKEAESIVSLLARLRVILKESVSHLDHYGIDHIPELSTAAALDEAQRILRDIKARDFQQFSMDVEIELERSKSLLDRVQLMQQSGKRVDRIWFKFDDTRKRVDDLIKIIRNSNRKISQTEQLDRLLEKRMKRIRLNIDEVSGINLYTEDRNFNTSRMITRARRNFKNTRKTFFLIEDLMKDLRNRSAALSEFEAMLWQLNNDYKNQYLDSAEEHALNLKAQAIKLEKLFNKTRDVADGPLRAAEAYQRIIDALRSAEDAANNASSVATQAYNVAFPGNVDESLVRTSKFAMDNSVNLREKASDLRYRVDSLSKNLGKHRRDLENTKMLVENGVERLDVVDQKMSSFSPLDLSSRIDKVLEDASNTGDSAEKTLEMVEKLTSNLTAMNNYTSQISNLDSSLFQEIRDNIAHAEGTTMKAVRLSTEIRRTSNRIEIRENNLRARIEALKRRITQTRQYASNIRVSLTTDDNGVCIRKYRPFLQPSTTSSINLGYAINSPDQDALLLFMKSSNSSDFMSVEMINRRIHFTWDAGGGSETLVHPLPLETNNRLASDDTKWYHITINRVGNIGELSVKPAFIKNSIKQLHESVTGVSAAGFSRMDLQPWDYTWIGGAPAQDLSYLGAKHFAGCLHYVILDGEPLGLWNFTESIGCDACNEGFELRIANEDQTSLGFNGRGYFKGYNNLRRSKNFYSVVLSFRSLDEDALLFLSHNEQKNQYFSIGLEDGHVTFIVKFSEQAKLVMKSEKKFNNMDEMIQIQATVQTTLYRGKRIGRLVVGDQDQQGTIKGGPDLDLEKEAFYFGGVDPEFNRDHIGMEIELRSLLGCMGGLNVMEVGKNPHSHGQSYGVDRTCTNLPHSDVGFLGQGYLEMPSRVLKRDSNFGFTFKTMESDALLMVSTFIGQPLRGGVPNPPDFYSVSLVEGHIDLRLYAGSERHRMMSKERFNNGKLHSFLVLKENRKVHLFVDDQIVNSTRLDRGSHVVEAPKEGGLFFGGVPDEVTSGVRSMVGSTRPLKGCIQDVIINDRLVPFNNPIRFDNAFIGRCADLPRNAMGGMEGDMKAATSCMPPKQHTVEYGALKFGDKTESHVTIPLDKKTLKLDFRLSFEFRTYYPSGLLFIVYLHKTNRRNKQKLNYLSVELLNGRLQVSIKLNRKEKKIVSPYAGLNSGEWKKIIIEKGGGKLRVLVDDHAIDKIKLRKKTNFGSTLIIGGLPKMLLNSSGLSAYEPFRGCFRNMEINNARMDIPSRTTPNRMVGVFQCFASVQPGSYFPGDAYAVYDNTFQVSPLLELRIEFRTWELNGILLSIADVKANVALSLELDNGAVILSVNIGHKHPFSAQVSFPNRYGLCDNQWHTVKAHFIKDSLTLKVDDYPESYGFNGSSNLRKTLAEASLFIGGLPESAPSGTLSSRENFKGCIRNIVLNSERKDWTDMYKLHNVLLNACPVL